MFVFDLQVGIVFLRCDYINKIVEVEFVRVLPLPPPKKNTQFKSQLGIYKTQLNINGIPVQPS